MWMFVLVKWLIIYTWKAIVWLYWTLDSVIEWMSKPFQMIGDKIKNFLTKDAPIPESVNRKFSVVNGLLPFLLLILAIGFSVISFWIRLKNWDSGDNYILDIFYNTTLGSFLGFMTEGLDFTPATVVAIAFSGVMLSACVDLHKTEMPMPWYIQLPVRGLCYTVYMVASSILAVLLTGVFESLGQWGVGTIDRLVVTETGSVFIAAGSILALIPLCYMAVLLCLVAVKTYAECFLFSVLGGTVGFTLILLLDQLPPELEVLKQILNAITMLGMFFGLDVIQDKVLDAFKEKHKKKR